MKEFNVIVIGVTQSGKSQFIKGLHDYAGCEVEPTRLKIGKGNEAITKASDLYTLQFNAFKVPKINKQPFVDAWENSVKSVQDKIKGRFHVFEKERKTEAEFKVDELDDFYHASARTNDFEIESKQMETPFLLNIIDTPGLDDTDTVKDDTVDVTHLANVLMKVKAFKEIHAVVLVLGMTSSFSGSLANALLTYSKNLSQLTQNFIILHTKYNVQQAMEEAKRNNTNFVLGDISPRVNALNDFFVTYGIQWGSQPIHVAMDNKADKYSKPCHRAFFYDGMSKFLSILQDLKPTQVKNIQVTKPLIFLDRDQHILQRIKYHIEKTKFELAKYSIGNEAENAKYSKLADEVAEISGKIFTMTQELQNLDTEEYIECGSLEWNENPTFFFQPHIVKVKEAVTEFDIVDVTKVKMVPFENPWRNEKQQKKQYSVGLMGGVIRGWHGRVRLFTTRRDVYKLRIAVLKSTIESKKELLISQKAHLKQVGMQLGGNETALDSLNNSLAQYEKALQQCKSEMCDLRFFIGCIDLYKSVVADNRSIVADQVELLVQAYVNHVLGDALPKYEPRAEAVPNVSRAEAVPDVPRTDNSPNINIATVIRDVTGHLSGVFLKSSR